MCSDAVCKLMENDPNPDFHMDFYEDGIKICCREDRERKIFISENRYVVDYGEFSVPIQYHQKWKIFLDKRKEMLKKYEALQYIEAQGHAIFPTVIGSRPK